MQADKEVLESVRDEELLDGEAAGGRLDHWGQLVLLGGGHRHRSVIGEVHDNVIAILPSHQDSAQGLEL